MTMNEDLEWKPQPEGLQQIIQLLKESQSIDNTIQKNVQKVNTFNQFIWYEFSKKKHRWFTNLFLLYFFKKLEELNKYPDFNNYLIYILTKLNSHGKLQKNSYLNYKDVFLDLICYNSHSLYL